MRQRALFEEFHRGKVSFNGTSCLRLWRTIALMNYHYSCRSALDFGCGRGLQYEQRIWDEGYFRTLEGILGYVVDKYDPAIPKFALPHGGWRHRTFDLVWCVDVLNCMPADEIEPTLECLDALASRCLIIGINSLECRKRLPDGTLAVSTFLRDSEWHARIDPLNRPGREVVLDLA